MASALEVPIPKTVVNSEVHNLPNEVRTRQQSIAEITEMIHVSFFFFFVIEYFIFCNFFD